MLLLIATSLPSQAPEPPAQPVEKPPVPQEYVVMLQVYEDLLGKSKTAAAGKMVSGWDGHRGCVHYKRILKFLGQMF